MTVQEILLLDSTVTIGVGANQLQKLISTMKYYKERQEAALTALEDKDQIIQQLQNRIKELETQTFKIRMINSIEL